MAKSAKASNTILVLISYKCKLPLDAVAQAGLLLRIITKYMDALSRVYGYSSAYFFPTKFQFTGTCTPNDNIIINAFE